MVVAGLLQGAAMLALHEWFKAKGFGSSDLVWAVPAYSLVILGPITFNFLRSEFSVAQSLRGAAIASLIIAATAGWFGWSYGTADDTKHILGPGAGNLLVFGFSSIVVWFVGLPFLQGGLRENSLTFPYGRLFDDAWRNTLLVTNCFAFTGLFWILLGLWAGLFLVLRIGFFKDLFSSRFFFYLANTMAISFAISLEEKEASALSTLRRHLLAFQTRLLPLAALIAILFLGTLPFTGLDSLWRTGLATPLMLCLQIVIIVLTNAAWQDGAQPAPFSTIVQWLPRAALALLPVIAGLCIWSLSLRIEQHGWSVDRVWAAVLVGLTTLYTLGYAINALSRGWLSALGTVNTWMALLLIGILLAIHTPLLDPQRISVSSQVSRLLAGVTEVDRFDFNYLRFNLGRPGDEALKALAELSGHPEADDIRAKAKEALARNDRHAAKQQPIPGRDEIAARMKSYPAEAQIPSTFVEYLHDRLTKAKFDYPLNPLKSGKAVPVLALDLGADSSPEYVLMVAPYPVFAQSEGKWRQIGQISFIGHPPKPEELQRLLENGDHFAVPRQWNDLRLGDQSGILMLRTERTPE